MEEHLNHGAEGAEEQKKAIERYGRNKNTFIKTIIGIASAGIIGFGSMSYVDQKNPYEDIPAMREYREMSKTLSFLKEEKYRLLTPNLQLLYQPEHLKPHLDVYLEENRKRAYSLDKAIEVVERDMKGVEQIHIAYDNFNKRRSDKLLYLGLGTVALVLSMGIAGIYKMLRHK